MILCLFDVLGFYILDWNLVVNACLIWVNGVWDCLYVVCFGFGLLILWFRFDRFANCFVYMCLICVAGLRYNFLCLGMFYMFCFLFMFISKAWLVVLFMVLWICLFRLFVLNLLLFVLVVCMRVDCWDVVWFVGFDCLGLGNLFAVLGCYSWCLCLIC